MPNEVHYKVLRQFRRTYVKGPAHLSSCRLCAHCHRRVGLKYAVCMPNAEGECVCLQEFYTEMKSVDRDNEVSRILNAFRLNPFEQIGVRFDSTPEEIRRQYRKVCPAL